MKALYGCVAWALMVTYALGAFAGGAAWTPFAGVATAAAIGLPPLTVMAWLDRRDRP